MTIQTSTSHDEWYEWARSTYSRRIRAGKDIYLWGSAGLEDIKFPTSLILHIRNELFGTPITFGSKTKSGPKKVIGILHPGECVSIPINDVSGIYATCKDESIVNCRITT
jgi:hypothetical protein